MSRRWTREPGAPCYAHDACETCRKPICDDCPDTPETCHHEEGAA